MKAGTGSLGERFSQQPGWTGLGAGLWKGSLPMAGGWSEMGFKDPPNPTQPILFLVLVAALPQQSWVFRKEHRQKEQTTNS